NVCSAALDLFVTSIHLVVVADKVIRRSRRRSGHSLGCLAGMLQFVFAVARRQLGLGPRTRLRAPCGIAATLGISHGESSPQAELAGEQGAVQRNRLACTSCNITTNCARPEPGRVGETRMSPEGIRTRHAPAAGIRKTG